MSKRQSQKRKEKKTKNQPKKTATHKHLYTKYVSKSVRF